jgi:hypothetical protein
MTDLREVKVREIKEKLGYDEPRRLGSAQG